MIKLLQIARPQFLISGLALFVFGGAWAILLDFRFLGVLSLMPLGASCIGLFKRPSQKPSATRVVIGIMITLAVFLILVDGYVVSLAFSQML